MSHRTLTVRGVSDAVLERLRMRAAAARRSLNGELLTILEHAAGAGDDAPPAAVAPATLPTAAPAGRLRAVSEPAATRYNTATDSFESIDRAALSAVCERYRITWLAVFGSSVRGEARPDSDVDVIVDFEPGQTPGFGIVRVAAALAPVLGGRRVDLVTRRGLAPRMRGRIYAEARTLYAR